MNKRRIRENTERELLEGLNEHTDIINNLASNNITTLSNTVIYTGIPAIVPETIAGRTEYFDTANEAKAYYCENSYASYILNNPQNLVQSIDGLLDYDANAWAWTGNRFKYVGSLSTTATATINDLGIIGIIQLAGTGSSGQYITDFRVFDATTGEYIYNDLLYYDTITNTPAHPNNYLNIVHNDPSITASITLQPNHTYVVFTMLEAYGSSLIGTSYINITAPNGSSWDSMDLDIDFY